MFNSKIIMINNNVKHIFRNHFFRKRIDPTRLSELEEQEDWGELLVKMTWFLWCWNIRGWETRVSPTFWFNKFGVVSWLWVVLFWWERKKFEIDQISTRGYPGIVWESSADCSPNYTFTRQKCYSDSYQSTGKYVILI